MNVLVNKKLIDEIAGCIVDCNLSCEEARKYAWSCVIEGLDKEVEDVKVVSHSDTVLCDNCDIGLTTLNQTTSMNKCDFCHKFPETDDAGVAL